jgi:hypothetical protein
MKEGGFQGNVKARDTRFQKPWDYAQQERMGSSAQWKLKEKKE